MGAVLSRIYGDLRAADVDDTHTPRLLYAGKGYLFTESASSLRDTRLFL